MSRYYFDTHDGELVRDEIGIECETFRDALDQATSGLADFAKDVVPGAQLCEMAVWVRDDHGHPLMQAILRLEIKRFD